MEKKKKVERNRRKIKERSNSNNCVDKENGRINDKKR